MDLYVAGRSGAKIVEELGISKPVIDELLRDPGFLADAHAHRENRRRRLVDMMEAYGEAAVLVHGAAMGAKATPTQLQAAQSVLDRIGIPRVQVSRSEEQRPQGPAMSAGSTPHEGRTRAEIIHYIEHGRYPDGSVP